jgi:hypothetical protein
MLLPHSLFPQLCVPALKSHEETRDCFFDFKRRKRDLEKSLHSGALCAPCSATLTQSFNPEIHEAVTAMIDAMKAQHQTSKATLHAESLKGSTQIGIITVREDEFDAVLNHFPERRHASSKTRLYEWARIKDKKGRELGVAIARQPEQGPGSTHAVARDMIGDLEPKWILLVGIAGGFPDSDYTLGDVLVSSRVHDFQVGAAIEDGPPEFQEQGGDVAVDVEKLLTHLPAMKKDLDG